jgi:hypothetical protein
MRTDRIAASRSRRNLRSDRRWQRLHGCAAHSKHDAFAQVEDFLRLGLVILIVPAPLLQERTNRGHAHKGGNQLHFLPGGIACAFRQAYAASRS